MNISAKTKSIKEKLFFKGYLMKELAEELEVSPTYLSNAVNNRVSISPRLAKNIANSLDVEISDIFEVKESIREEV